MEIRKMEIMKEVYLGELAAMRDPTLHTESGAPLALPKSPSGLLAVEGNSEQTT